MRTAQEEESVWKVTLSLLWELLSVARSSSYLWFSTLFLVLDGFSF